MVKKEDLLNKLKNAKVKHQRWFTYAEAIYNGMDISEEYTPKSHTDCEFGKWMLENGQFLYHIKSSEGLDEDHRVLHAVYMQLYKDMNETKKGNIFNRAFIKRQQKEKIEKGLSSLKSISQNIINTLDNMIDEVKAMPESKINAIFN